MDVAHWLLREEGLFVGSSSAMNVAGAVQLAVNWNNSLGGDSEGSDESENGSDESKNGSCGSVCVVTVICDGGQRHLTRFWNRDFIIDWGLLWPGDDESAWRDRLKASLGVDLLLSSNGY